MGVNSCLKKIPPILLGFMLSIIVFTSCPMKQWILNQVSTKELPSNNPTKQALTREGNFKLKKYFCQLYSKTDTSFFKYKHTGQTIFLISAFFCCCFPLLSINLKYISFNKKQFYRTPPIYLKYRQLLI